MKSKTHWNYRVIKTADKKLKGLSQSWSWGIYEVYYTRDKPTSWSKDPMYPVGESWNELVKDYNIMFQAFMKPTLELRKGKLIEIGICK